MSSETAVRLSVEERNFLVRRAIQGDYRWVGVSSDAMVIAALTGSEPTAWPFDGWDLGRCLITRRVAPAHLHAAMDSYIEQAMPKVEGSYHGLDAADEMAEKSGPVVEEMLAEPHWCDIPSESQVMNPGTGEEQWPVQELCRSGAGHLYIPAPSMRATDAETYHPASAPNVLTPEEARLLAKFGDQLRVTSGPYRNVLDRLETWAEEEGL